jgi:RNA polymerase primary sigma factor
MRIRQSASQSYGLAILENPEVDLLDAIEERALLQELAACKTKLAQALASIEGIEVPVDIADPQALAQCATTANQSADDGPTGARLGATHRKYSELRSKLSMANLRLVAHIAKRFRDRGIPYADLLQEGFCGLLEAIDRFDLNHQTKLATYATWWIRQSMQRAVASGAYPVRLTPRHLRQLAQCQDELEHERFTREASARSDESESAPSEMIHRIHAATRPTVSLDAALAKDSSFNLLQTMGDSDDDPIAEVETDEAVQMLIKSLRPREQQVLSLRFGLGGHDRLSLSQVGRCMEVSKERVRQIQDRALEKLRGLAEKENLVDRLPLEL